MTTPTDHMTIAEIIHDFATRQGDLTDRWAREDLAAILEQRMVAGERQHSTRADMANARADRWKQRRDDLAANHERLRSGVEALAVEWEADDQASLDRFGQHQYATTLQLAGMLRDAIDHVHTAETEGAS